MNTETKRRSTWQQAAVREALGEVGTFISAQQLFHRMADEGSSVSVATIYRSLARLAEDGQADVHLDPDGQQLFRACDTAHHHHHLICRQCGATVEISAEPVERWARETAAEHGYIAESHVIDIIGLCPDCAR